MLPRDLNEKTKMAFLTSVNVFPPDTHIKGIILYEAGIKMFLRSGYVREKFLLGTLYK